MCVDVVKHAHCVLCARQSDGGTVTLMPMLLFHGFDGNMNSTNRIHKSTQCVVVHTNHTFMFDVQMVSFPLAESPLCMFMDNCFYELIFVPLASFDATLGSLWL